MIGIGTLVDIALIILGGLTGLLFGRFITLRVQDALMKATAVAIIFVGIGGAVSNMLELDGATAMIVISLALGSLVGEVLNIETRIESFGRWLKERSGSSGDPEFVDAFVTCSLSVGIGAMAIVGAIQDGITGDWSTLAVKGIIDALLVCAMTASMGKGCIFSAIPVLIFQGSCTLLAHGIEPIMTDAAVANLSLVGSILIFCIGINLIWEKTFKVGNMMPAVVVAAALAFL